MQYFKRPSTVNTSQRWWISLPFAIALLSLGFSVWASTRVVVYPYDGIPGLDSRGYVGEIDPTGPSYGQLKEGDTIVSVNGVPTKEAFPFYAHLHAGDQVNFEVKRGETIQHATIHLSIPPLHEIFERLAPLLVALIFWGIGVGVQAFKPNEGATWIYFMFFEVSAVLLTAGVVSSASPPWVAALFSFLLWLIGPLSVDFHLNFPQETKFRGKRYYITLLYGFALLGGLPYLIWGSETVRSNPIYQLLQSTGRVYLAFNLLLVVGLLIFVYTHASSPGVRGKIRIVVLGGVLSALLPLTLTILPDALQKSPIIPYAYALIILGILPLTYGYAIFRHRLIKVEKHVNRGATFILMYSVLGGFYLVLYAFLNRWLGSQSLLINTVLVLSLASVFVPFQRWTQKIVDTLFYGGWYDYRSAVTQITQGLEQVMDLKELAEQVSERLAQTLRLEDTCVFLRDLRGEFTVIAVAPRARLSSAQPLTFSVLPVSSLTFLLKMGGDVGRSSLQQALSEVYFTPEESQLLNSEQDHLWVPIIGHGLVQGFLALGPKFGGDIFSGEDLDILRLISRQISPVLENINLLTRLRQHAAELEQRVEERTAELHNAKERVEAILAGVGDGVIVTDLDRTIQKVNTAYEEQTGFSEAELIDRKFDDLLSEHNDPSVLEEMRLTLSEGRVWRGELMNERKGGGLFNIQMAMAPVRDQSGNMVGYVGSLHDITREKELARLKDRFVSDVSHELRTPTTNISLYLDLMEDAPLQKRQEYLNILKDQSYVLRKLVEDILDLSRLAMGRSKKIEFTAVDLNQITEQVVIAHRPLAEASHLALTFEPCWGLPKVNGEPNQLGRVITNLLSNSVRYTFRGSVSLSTYADETQVCLEIRDTGIGIDPEDLPHLFERFYRGRQVRQSRIHGTGLGLAIVKEIVDLHDGSIEIHSEPEKGSIFRVWLPIFKD